MKIKNIFTYRRFDKSYKKLPKKIKDRAKGKEKIFRENSFHPALEIHKFSGKERASWAFDIDFHYRIKSIFLSDEKVLFLDVGTHDIYN
ncbi:type II toxin-antitoxin system mRNA interferase toxin, RelE/StbE family [Candidatus Jorgensenbacteria bacterium CG_4_10_14_0_8_um_filter_39_13]|uniref:Type II toxin-antitoxin system mRNA interferase toxin, RelE/StbE family n=2 Tax=Candidatus Joergenseniibacteriota TaxID=1752739 RepID=A0A2M7RID0_9BACT|nr:MAG: hypothetical protein COV54_01005 [Candidatus Jorgensenbacteria bacterium CG11_big_fil_rev_8_21_14_0_20_38_23]PIV12990.1 MAG: type II toxin-antitoxin system mRNA interferase toxin, RelE/StbE family [Candidatus Jorgensenbacteria bacterium CG03_land_8_20_14_0_80_38_39]PIW97735.1 MAG: type II toxin-antitoxin system mRNA interferase toxin, RelE/StbE family [Candidatus Jorgensenbacteria bacterium CG_4_8_14_3_um_filter_38_10]PIY96454.1 MAG: type II toxin-antitoxin system mRNA interferase toxin,